MKKTLIFEQTEQFRNQLELKHLRTRNRFVLGIILFMMILFILYSVVSHYLFKDIYSILIGFVLLLLANFSMLAYGREQESFFHMNKYVTTMGLFSLTIAIIFMFKSPSMVMMLFIAYAISMFYQDMKVLFISDIMLLSSGLLIIINYPSYLGLESVTQDVRFGIGFYFVMFVLILTTANYIFTKQKSFFFNQIVSSSEIEYRNLDLLFDLKKDCKDEEYPIDLYFDQLDEFLAAFSRKIGSENIFTKKVEILREISKGLTLQEFIKKYPEYQVEDYERFSMQGIGNHQQLRKMVYKCAYSYQVELEPKEIFSETQFKSFNHQSDSIEIKIIAFVLFYTTLRKGYSILPGLTEKQIYDSIIHTDFCYYIDPRVLKIYQDNSDVFEQIIKDAFDKKVNS